MSYFMSVFEDLNAIYEEAEVKESLTEEVKKVDDLAEEDIKVEECEDVSEEPVSEKLTEEADEDSLEDEFEETPAEEDESPEVSEETEEALQSVLECEKCGALVVKSKDEVAFDDESELVNIEDECAFCGAAEGYRVIGSLLPVGEEEKADEAATDEAEITEPVLTDDSDEIIVIED